MAEKKKNCKGCGIELNEEAKRYLCDECKLERKAKWKSRLKQGGKILLSISAVAVLVYLVSRGSNGDYDSNTALDLGENKSDDILPVSETEHAAGEKYWNKRTQNWEIDGKPYTYRVTYKDVRDGEIHTHDYADVEKGYEAYEHLRKQWYTSGTKWEHIPPSND